MKLALNLSLLFFYMFIFVDKSLSLTDYQIKKICKREKKQSSCKKSLQKKRLILQQGNLIEIPTIPYKR